MDVDTTNQSAPPLSTARPTATDPRLNRVSNTSQHRLQANRTLNSSPLSPTPGTPLPEQQNASNSPSTGCPPGSNCSVKESESAPTSDLGKIVSSLNQLFDARAALVWRQQERAVLEREDALLRRDFNRAQALPASFPAMVDTLQSMKDNPSTGLQRLDAELTKQQAKCLDMAEELRAMLQAASSSFENERSMKLEAKLKEGWKAEFKQWETECKEKWKAELKEEMADAEKRLEATIRSNIEAEFKEKLFSDLKERLEADFKDKQLAWTTPNAESQDVMLSEFQEKFGRLENSVSFVSTSNRNLGTQISRVEKWKRDVEEGRIRLPSQSEAPVATHESKLDLEKLKGQIPVLEARLDQVAQQHSNWSGLEHQVKENTATIDLLKSGRELAQKAEQDKTATLEAQIRQIQEHVTVSSEKIASLETQPRPASGEDSASAYLSEKVNILSQQMAAFRGVTGEMQKHHGAIHDHSLQIEACKKMQETMAVALRSLEHRYLNINSEELVNSMANAMHEMYPGMQKVLQQLRSLQVQINANKEEITKENDRLKSSMDNEDKASLAVALQEFKQISERFVRLQETQREQAEDIARHLEEVKELQGKLEGFSGALSELGDKQAEDVSDLSEELKALVPRLGEFDTRLENQTKQYKDLEESSQCVLTQLDTLKESTSEDNIRRICEDAQREKLQDITGQMEEFNLQGKSVLKMLQDFRHKGLGSPDLGPESAQSLTNGLLSTSGMNGLSAAPQNGNSANLPERPQLAPAAQAPPNVDTPSNGTQALKSLRAIMSKPTPSPGATDGSFRVKGVASQTDSERGQNGTNSQPSPQQDSRDTPISATVTANPPSPTMTITQNQNAATRPDPRTTNSVPSNGQPSNRPPQASVGEKRQRQPTISDDESREERRANPVLANSAKPSPAPSSASDVPLRKSKKAKKKEKRQESQLK